MAWTGTRPTAFVNVVKADLAKRRNQIAAEALQLVVQHSPVDTGAFRGSHRVSVDTPDYGHDAAQTDTNGQAAVQTGLTVIATANQPFQTVTVQTNLPYAEKLEAGHSKKQAPQGVYRPAYAFLRAKYARS